jgi:hypothetical protein
VTQLTSKDVYNAECASKQLCFVAFLPLLEESGKDGRVSYIDVLKEAAAKYKTRPFGWVWSEATRQSLIEANLEVSATSRGSSARAQLCVYMLEGFRCEPGLQASIPPSL